jgi:hypothetical protein
VARQRGQPGHATAAAKKMAFVIGFAKSYQVSIYIYVLYYVNFGSTGCGLSLDRIVQIS